MNGETKDSIHWNTYICTAQMRMYRNTTTGASKNYRNQSGISKLHIQVEVGDLNQKQLIVWMCQCTTVLGPVYC